MASEPIVAGVEKIDSLILTIRGQRVMLDSDLARIYGVPLKRLNEQVKRNRDRFPLDFAFQLTKQEVAQIRSQIATGSLAIRSQIATGLKYNPNYRPWAFTEHGAIMLASVLSSLVAVAASVAVVRAFVRLREMAITHKDLAAKLDELENKVKGHDEALTKVFQALRQIMTPPSRTIGFHVRHASETTSEVSTTTAAKRR